MATLPWASAIAWPNLAGGSKWGEVEVKSVKDASTPAVRFVVPAKKVSAARKTAAPTVAPSSHESCSDCSHVLLRVCSRKASTCQLLENSAGSTAPLFVLGLVTSMHSVVPSLYWPHDQLCVCSPSQHEREREGACQNGERFDWLLMPSIRSAWTKSLQHRV